MTFDAKLFGSRFREAVLRKHSPTEAVKILQTAGLDKITPPRLSEYFAGSKVPTLERFTIMVMALQLDVSVIFPGWGPKVRPIRHPREKTIPA
jgi:hypothetical protein